MGERRERGEEAEVRRVGDSEEGKRSSNFRMLRGGSGRW